MECSSDWGMEELGSRIWFSGQITHTEANAATQHKEWLVYFQPGSSIGWCSLLIPVLSGNAPDGDGIAYRQIE